MNQALAHDGPCLIEVPIDPHDCSKKLRGAAAWLSPMAGLRSGAAQTSETRWLFSGLDYYNSEAAYC